MSLRKTNDRRILVVDDDPQALDIFVEALGWDGYQIQKSLLGEDAHRLLNAWKPHLVIIDVETPGLNCQNLLRDLRQREEYVAAMFVSSETSTESIVQFLDAGADDYISKPFDPQELLARVRTRLRIKDLYDSLRDANEKLTELVDTDDLTGLFNMRSLYSKLDGELERARRYNRQVAVVMMDMDNFKSVNDGHNHLFGSFVLSQVGRIIRNQIRANDIPARYGGDEFLIVLTEVNSEGAFSFCERLRKEISTYLFKSGTDEIHLTASLGFAITNPGQEEIESKHIVKQADYALYEAKRDGRNCIRIRDIAQKDKRIILPVKKQAG